MEIKIPKREERICPACFVRIMFRFLNQKPLNILKLQETVYVAKELGIAKYYPDVSKIELLLESLPPDLEYKLAFELGKLDYLKDIHYGDIQSNIKKPKEGTMWKFAQKLEEESKGDCGS